MKLMDVKSLIYYNTGSINVNLKCQNKQKNEDNLPHESLNQTLWNQYSVKWGETNETFTDNWFTKNIYSYVGYKKFKYWSGSLKTCKIWIRLLSLECCNFPL